MNFARRRPQFLLGIRDTAADSDLHVWPASSVRMAMTSPVPWMKPSSGEVNDAGWPDTAIGERVSAQVLPASVVSMMPPGAATTQSDVLTGWNESAGCAVDWKLVCVDDAGDPPCPSHME